MANDPPGSRAEPTSARRPGSSMLPSQGIGTMACRAGPWEGLNPTALCSCRAFPQQSLFQCPPCKVEWSEDTN